MLYRDALNYMYMQLPMFHRVGSAAYKNNLDNTLAISARLKQPEKKFKSIHIAGTNGKGSSSHLLASILFEAGYKTALYTSPHLKDFRERIKINGSMIPKKKVSSFIEKHKDFFNDLKPSFFEMTVGLAFEWFVEEEVDIAVIETGLGGRLDSTNIIFPVVSLITNISLDHTALLGSDTKSIAGEKAGIIKKEVPVVLSEKDLSCFSVFANKANETRSELIVASEIYQVEKSKVEKGLANFEVKRKGKSGKDELKCPLLGDYQSKNIAGVLTVCDVLKREGFSLLPQAIQRGVKRVVENTGLSGRWQILNKKPLTIADTGHNEAGIKLVLEQIRQTAHRKLHIVLGMVNDKDIEKILQLFPQEAGYYFCEAKIPRALPKEELKNKAALNGLNGKSYNSVRSALKAATKAAGSKDLIYVGGSTFVVAEVV